MNTSEIDQFAEQNHFIQPYYGGCLPVDMLPKKKINDLPKIYCVNTCEADEEKDCHWISIFITKNRLHYFDTGGGESFKWDKHLKKFIDRQKKPVVFNRQQIQHETSISCGLFCLVFMHASAIRIKFEKFIKFFNYKDLKSNDYIVAELFDCIFLKNKNNCLVSKRKR